MAYIRFPFAESGDRQAVPVIIQPDDSVSLQEGYTVQYEQDPTTIPSARRVERQLFNGLMNLISAEVQQYQQFGVPLFITPAENGGVAFPYSIGALVRFNPGAGFRVYRSLIDSNTDTPGTVNWLDTSTYVTSANAITEITTDVGLDGAGTSGTIALSLDFNELPVANPVNADFVVLSLNTGQNRRASIANFLSTFITKALIDPLNIDADTLDGVQASGFVAATRAVNTASVSGLGGGGALNADRNLTLDVDNLTAASAVGTNEIAFSQGASTTRKTTLTQAVSAVVTAGYINALTGVDADTVGGVALTGLVQTSRVMGTPLDGGISGGGDLSANRNLRLDINGLTTALPLAGEFIAYYDGGTAQPRKASISTAVGTVVTKGFVDALNVDADTLDGINSTGFVQTSRSITTAASSGIDGGGTLAGDLSLSLDVEGLVTATPVATDVLAFGDLSAGPLSSRKATLTAVKTAMGLQNLTDNTFTGAFTATGDITAFSDVRLKDVIDQVDPSWALNAILSWNKVTFTFNDAAKKLGCDDRTHLGFLAHDVNSTHPELVLPSTLGDTEYQTVAYDHVPVVLAAAMEALVQRVERAEADNMALAERLARVEDLLGVQS